MAFPNEIDSYKQKLGYGARTNLYRMELTFPSVLALVDLNNDVTIMTRTAVLPGSRKIEPIDIAYKGEWFTLAGEKGKYDAEFKIVVQNSQDFKIRNAFELWMNIIQQDFTSLRTSPTTYKSSAYVMQLDNGTEVTRNFQFRGLYPIDVTSIELGAGEGNISETTVSFAYDTFELVAI